MISGKSRLVAIVTVAAFPFVILIGRIMYDIWIERAKQFRKSA